MVQSEPEICDFCQFTARSRLHTATENSSESAYDDEAAGEVRSVRTLANTRRHIFLTSSALLAAMSMQTWLTILKRHFPSIVDDRRASDFCERYFASRKCGDWFDALGFRECLASAAALPRMWEALGGGICHINRNTMVLTSILEHTCEDAALTLGEALALVEGRPQTSVDSYRGTHEIR